VLLPGYDGDGKTCAHPPLRVYACVRGECGDGMCEPGEAPACGCVEDCPEAAWDSTAEPPMDAGAREITCLSQRLECDGVDSFCTRASAESRVATCIVDRALTPYYAMRCGPYDAVVAQGTDSARYFYYDEAGRLVGESELGLGSRGCFSYDAAFMLPRSCQLVTPACDDASNQ
jgi:hypothetical protein